MIKKLNNNWVISIVIIIFLLLILKNYFHKLINTEFFVSGPKFKKSSKNKKSNKKSKSNNPLSHFGFKYDKSENFNDSNDSFSNALDEAERLDVDSLNMSNMKDILSHYNKNITKKLKKAEDDNTIVSVVNQGKVMYEEFKNLFDLGLFF